jgi:hypothetical protein
MRIRHVAATILAASLLTTAAVTTVSDAAAQTQLTEKERKKKAVQAYKAGQKQFKTGDYAAALPHYREADDAYPGAAPKHKIAVCLDKLGRIEEAVAAYEGFIAFNPGEKYADRITSSQARIDELRAQLPATVMLEIEPPGVAASVTLDGQAAAGTELQMTAGDHEIVVSAPDHESYTEKVTVSGGEKRTLSVMLKPTGGAVAPPPDVGGGEEDTGDDAGGGLKIAGYVLLGAGVVSAGVATVFGVQALGAANDFDDTPTNALADRAEDKGLVADILYGVGGAAVIGGAVLLYLGYSADGGEDSTATGPVFMPYAGPNGGGANVTVQF